MVKSMTGFGRYEDADDKKRISVEIKSVNHRYLDLSVKLPRRLNAMEPRIRKLLHERIGRGKVDVYLLYENTETSGACLRYHPDLAAAYLAHLRRMSEDFSLDMDIRVSTLSRYPEVFSMEESREDNERVWDVVSVAVEEAFSAFLASREKEGAALEADILGKLADMEETVLQIQARAPQLLEEYRARLTQKVEELLGDVHVDESRLATEIVLYADKVCTDEETVRLLAHIRSMRDVFSAGSEIGRKLDFIAQEMNREANTILSKANDEQTAQLGIALKTAIEKIREQIQNIE